MKSKPMCINLYIFICTCVVVCKWVYIIRVSVDKGELSVFHKIETQASLSLGSLIFAFKNFYPIFTGNKRYLDRINDA